MMSNQKANPKVSFVPMNKTDEKTGEHCTFSKAVSAQDSSSQEPQHEQTHVRVLTLNHNEHLDSTLFILQKDFILQFRCGSTLFGRKVTVFTNYPETSSDVFIRDKYFKLPWKSDSINTSDDTALFVEIDIQRAGSFHFFFTYDESNDRNCAQGSGYFIVNPTITRGIDNELLPMNCIQCQTVLSKCLGPYDQWIDRLKVTAECGYNMVHFTPVQELGISRSGYSLSNQHKLNPEFNSEQKTCEMSDLQNIIDKMDNEWKIVSITDIVVNHTASDSSWLIEHPEAGYNMVTAPHLRPAYLVDRALHHFAVEISENKWLSRGIPLKINTEEHLQAVRSVLFTDVLSKIRVEEFYQVDVDEMVRNFENQESSNKNQDSKNKNQDISNQNQDSTIKLEIIQDPKFHRKSSTVSISNAVKMFNRNWPGSQDVNDKKRSCHEFRICLEHLNANKKEEINAHLYKAVDCTIDTMRYERLQPDGPKLPEVSEKYPLSTPYFNHYGPDMSLENEELMSMGPESCFLMAHNGWVMEDDALMNFASPGSYVYLRRELIAWGDSVKLRYGDKPEDNPYLWEHMKKYVEQTAEIFKGIRLDNCHSTPIHVAEYLLDCARKVRPDLYVIAELFTNSEQTDNIFVNRLGINSLIREALSAVNSYEEGRLLYLYGGEPVGAFMLPPVRPLVRSLAHAIFLDITHDNKSPCEIRTAWDVLPSSALVSMASCATGSTRGYDEIVPNHINIVTEERRYCSWAADSNLRRGHVTADSGILRAKRLLNDLHYELGSQGFTQIFVDQVSEHIITVTRHNPETHQSVVLVSYTSFRPPASIHNNFIKSLKVQGKFLEIIFEICLTVQDTTDENRKVPGNFIKDADFINGINEFKVQIGENLQPEQSNLIRQVSAPAADTTEFEYTPAFSPGSVLVLRLSLLSPAQDAIKEIRSILGDFSYEKKINEINTRNLKLLAIVKDLSLSDLNRILYRCDQEERDEGKGLGTYEFQNYGPLVYCGLQGLISSFCEIRVKNDLGHPICGNLRDGDWLMDYVVKRLVFKESTRELGLWMEDVFCYMKKLPRYLIPAYFDAVITVVYLTLINHAWANMSKFISDGSSFVKALGLCSVQFCGVVKSALLPEFSKGQIIQSSVTLAAGLPHFCIGYMRNWGRDTFIALPGNLLITGRFQEARCIILAYGATLRHGLIPNLLDGGAKARFNCRDAVWFWLYSIVKYVQCVPDGHLILKDNLSRIFPTDQSEAQTQGFHEVLLEDLIQESMQKHFQGLKFRERNAGTQIDSQMLDEGFNNEIGVNLETGFPFGGNVNNCGTWMDKMGSSDRAGNKGKPITPRDGSAVEIVGLCAAVLKFLHRMNEEGKFSHSLVTKEDSFGNQINWTYKFWETKIIDNFEKLFWISENSDNSEEESKPELINRRGIYKDIQGATQSWTDYQLRCNFPIAIVVAPDLFNPEHARIALNNVENILLGPLGIKTLDPSDWKYRGDYDNANDSADENVARGANYHQGPEWLWPVGWFLRAKLLIASRLGTPEVLKELDHVKSLLATHFTHISSSPWRSLPELTNSNGSFCADSNPAQSWSTGCILEVLWDMDELNRQL